MTESRYAESILSVRHGGRFGSPVDDAANAKIERRHQPLLHLLLGRRTRQIQLEEAGVRCRKRLVALDDPELGLPHSRRGNP